jgi:hypothetical protein
MTFRGRMRSVLCVFLEARGVTNIKNGYRNRHFKNLNDQNDYLI